MTDLANRIKKLRVDSQKSQEDVAAYLGITYQAYAHYEKGRREPSVYILIKLSEIFNVTLDYLLKGI